MKKKILAALLCAAMALSATGCNRSEIPDDYEDDRPSKSDKADKDKDNSSGQPGDTNATSADFFEYSKKNGTIIITKYIGSDKNVIIPGTINGDPVAFIAEGAFSDTGVTSVTIPNGITEIKNNTFFGCFSLTSITIPNGVTRIGDSAFFGCTSLASVNIPNSVTSIGYGTFYGCPFTSVALPDGVNSICDNSFMGCTIVYKGNTYSPDNYMVLYRLIMNIKEESSSSVPSSSSSSTLSSSSSSKQSSSKPISSSSSKPVTSTTPNTNETSANKFEYKESNGTITITKYIGSDTKVDIPSKINGKPVTAIDSFAFKDCKSLTSVTIPNSVTSIGKGAFMSCLLLKSVTVPNSVTSIGYNVFFDSNCTITYKGNTYTSSNYTSLYNAINNSSSKPSSSSSSTTKPVTPVTPTTNETSADQFWYEEENGTITIKKYIGKDKEVCIPSKINGKPVTKISLVQPRDAYDYNDVITSVTIPNSVTTIDDQAFYHCYSLKSVTIPNSVTTIGESAFSWCGLTSVTIPNSVTSIGKYAFNSCTSLTSVTIPNSVTSIGNFAFISCSSLTSVTMPDSVTSISIAAFNTCKCTITYKGTAYTSDNYNALYRAINGN